MGNGVHHHEQPLMEPQLRHLQQLSLRTMIEPQSAQACVGLSLDGDLAAADAEAAERDAGGGGVAAGANSGAVATAGGRERPWNGESRRAASLPLSSALAHSRGAHAAEHNLHHRYGGAT